MMRLWLALAAGLAIAGSVPATTAAPAQPAAAATETFRWREVMVPMRDGVRLQTAIFTPTGRKGPLPILLRRTPYGVPGKDWTLPWGMQALAEDGYIVVVQNLRGRFKSEGKFSLSDSMRLDHGSTIETRDAWDTIDWLVKNVPDNNGKVGIYGVSYDGLTAAATLLDPHPALKAVSEQASPVDQWMNDDHHRYGALRLSYAFEYAVMEEADQHDNTLFDFDTWDTYDWYLRLGPVSNINARHLRGSIPFWNNIVAHPNYDAFWRSQAWSTAINGTRVPTLNVAGLWDQEDPWGPWQIRDRLAKNDPDRVNLMVAGPWNHGGWRRTATTLGPVALGQDVSLAYLRDIEAPFFAYWLHGKGTKPAWAATTFQTGSNAWRQYRQWPPAAAREVKLYFHADGRLDFIAPGAGERGAARRYVSDPANPVPYRRRPISPTYPGLDWRFWESDDQRFADHRPDVLTFTSAPLDRDITVTGEVVAKLYAATSGTDSDFVVKLIDVFPERVVKPDWAVSGAPQGEYAKQVNGYQLPIAMEVRRGRYLKSFTTPSPLPANRALLWDVPLHARDHVFAKGHRIMVQVQSSWFPLIDRNPQRFVPSIYAAQAKDFVKATQTVFSSPDRPSHIVLPVME